MPTPTDLTNALIRYQDARPALKAAMHASALALATRIADDRDALMVKLDKRWQWCDANTGNARFTEREDALLFDLQTYTQQEDALCLALGVLFPVVDPWA